VISAERKFVATPLDIGLRIGGAAEFAGLDAPPNYRRCDALLALRSLLVVEMALAKRERTFEAGSASPHQGRALRRRPGGLIGAKSDEIDVFLH